MPWEKQFDIDAVLDKTMRAFWAHGYEATSMQDLVDCTGVNRGSLYATYGDKRELFIAALRRYHAMITEQVLANLERQRSPREAIRGVFEMFIGRETLARGNNGCFLTNTALELAAHDKEVGRIVARAQAEVENFFARMIAKAKAAGEARASVDPQATARGFLAAMIGIAVLSRSRPEPALLHSIVEEAMGRLD